MTARLLPRVSIGPKGRRDHGGESYLSTLSRAGFLGQKVVPDPLKGTMHDADDRRVLVIRHVATSRAFGVHCLPHSPAHMANSLSENRLRSSSVLQPAGCATGDRLVVGIDSVCRWRGKQARLGAGLKA